MTQDIAWPNDDAYAPLAKGKPKAERPAPPDVCVSVSGGAKPGVVSLSFAPKLWGDLQWFATWRLAVSWHTGEHATFLRLTVDPEGTVSLRKPPAAPKTGEPRLLLALGRCAERLGLPARGACDPGVAWRMLWLGPQDAGVESPPDTLEICIDRAAPDTEAAVGRRGGRRARTAFDASPSERAPSPAAHMEELRAGVKPPPLAVTDDRSAEDHAAEATAAALAAGALRVEDAPVSAVMAAKATARSMRAMRQETRLIIAEIARLHGLAVDPAWIAEACRRPHGAAARAAEEA